MKKTSKEEILKASIALFKQQGYHHTSMENIATACGLIKGSIYHHFKGKDAILLAGLNYLHQFFEEEIFEIVHDSTLEPKEKARLMIEKIDNYFLNSQGGCLFGNLALELSNEENQFKDAIKAYFDSWQQALQKLFEYKYSLDESIKLSKEYVALTQGAIMMMNLFDDQKLYLGVGEKLIREF